MSTNAKTVRWFSRDKSTLAWLILLPAAALIASVLLTTSQLLTVAGLVAVVIAVAILVKPDCATLLFVFAMYINAPVVAVRFHGVPRLLAAATIGLLLYPVAYHLLIRRQKIIMTSAVPLILLFIFVQALATLNAERPDAALSVLTTSITEGLILFLLVINVVRTTEMVRRITWTLVLAGASLGALGLVQKVTGSYDRNYGGLAQIRHDEQKSKLAAVGPPRAAGPIGEKNYYAQFMMLLVPLALSRFSSDRSGVYRGLAMVATLLILGGVVLTASRGAALGFMAMLVAMAALRCISFRDLMIIALSGALFVAASPEYRVRLASLANMANFVRDDAHLRQTEKSFQGRASEMLAAGLIFWEHPLLGVGPGNFPFHFLGKASLLGFQVHAEERLAHCALLEIAAEGGILGVVCVLAILLVTMRDLAITRGITSDSELKAMTNALLVTLVVLMVTSLFLSFAYVRYYWLILALAGAAARVGMDAERACPAQIRAKG